MKCHLASLPAWTGLVLLALLGLFLNGCSTKSRQPPMTQTVPLIEAPAERPKAVNEPRTGPTPAVAQIMVIADILYDARKALEDNRLMLGRNNAYDLFNNVLDIAPDNEVALAGIQEIAARYITLANNATRVGQYDQATTYLDRASLIEPSDENLKQARLTLQSAREQQGEFFSLNEQQLRDRSLDLMVELGEIGHYLQENELMFLITARTDEEARWIYQTMRQAVGGRLRGNIALGGQPGIRVQQPAAEACPSTAC